MSSGCFTISGLSNQDEKPSPEIVESELFTLQTSHY
jgi:hypothetical protein